PPTPRSSDLPTRTGRIPCVVRCSARGCANYPSVSGTRAAEPRLWTCDGGTGRGGTGESRPLRLRRHAHPHSARLRRRRTVAPLSRLPGRLSADEPGWDRPGPGPTGRGRGRELDGLRGGGQV